MLIKSFRFSIQELGGALGDLGTLLPLMISLILINGFNTTTVLLGFGLFYIISGLYYRIPMPVQPLKAVSAIAISLGLSTTVIGAAGLIMGIILLLLSMTNLISTIVKFFPQAMVRGIQLSVGLLLLKKGVELSFGKAPYISDVTSNFNQMPISIILAVSAGLIFVFFKFILSRHSERFPPSLALLILGLGVGVAFGAFPSLDSFGATLPNVTLPNATDLWLALTVLVIPQLPLTLGNAVVSTWNTAETYFESQAQRVKPRSLATSMGLANIIAGLFGAVPMCHGSGGLTAHYKLGARTGGANIMVGSLLLFTGLVFGSSALNLFTLIPFSVLGVLLAIIGIYHVFLIRDLKSRIPLAVACTVALVTVLGGNLAFGFGAGIILHHLLKLDISSFWHRVLLGNIQHHTRGTRLTGIVPRFLR